MTQLSLHGNREHSFSRENDPLMGRGCGCCKYRLARGDLQTFVAPTGRPMDTFTHVTW